MKKLFYLLIIVGLAVTSCNKPEAIPLEQDVTFKAVAFESGFKSDDICTSDVAHYAVLKIQYFNIDTQTYDAEDEKILDIFYLNGTMYTNTLKLNTGKYKLTSFVLMNYGDDNAYGTTVDGGEDVIVYASPVEGSLNAEIVEGLPLTFNVGVFTKNEINLQVLCFDEVNYTDFGFSWFAINFTNVGNNDLVFFGDFCTKYFEDYVGSLYENQANGLRHDMPAIFRIEVINITDPSDPLDVDIYNNLLHEDNSPWYGVGAPLVVPSPDDPSINNEIFEFVLSIYVKVGAGFQIKEFARFTSNDAGDLNEITKGIDGVYDFVLGSCVPDADLILPPYMNLPDNVTMSLDTWYGSTDLDAEAYVDITLSNFNGTDDNSGYDINTTETYPSFCGDLYTVIGDDDSSNDPDSYVVDVYSSLYPADLLTSHAYFKVEEINWLGNNLAFFPDYTWIDLQHAIWILNGQLNEDGTYTNNSQSSSKLGSVSQTTLDMVEEAEDAIIALNDADLNYAPPVGGWAAVMFVGDLNNDGTPTIQLLFTLVDP